MTSKRLNETVLPINREEDCINISAISFADIEEPDNTKQTTTDMVGQPTSSDGHTAGGNLITSNKKENDSQLQLKSTPDTLNDHENGQADNKDLKNNLKSSFDKIEDPKSPKNDGDEQKDEQEKDQGKNKNTRVIVIVIITVVVIIGIAVGIAVAEAEADTVSATLLAACGSNDQLVVDGECKSCPNKWEIVRDNKCTNRCKGGNQPFWDTYKGICVTCTQPYQTKNGDFCDELCKDGTHWNALNAKCEACTGFWEQ